MARCTSAAATAESTPPDSPQIARPVADLGADLLDLLLDDVDHRPGRPAAGDVEQEVLEHLLAVLGVQHLGVPLHAGEPAVEVLEGGDRACPRSRRARRSPSGAATTESPWLIQTLCSRGHVRRAACRASVTSTGVRPYSERPVRRTSPPRLSAIAWKP